MTFELHSFTELQSEPDYKTHRNQQKHGDKTNNMNTHTLTGHLQPPQLVLTEHCRAGSSRAGSSRTVERLLWRSLLALLCWEHSGQFLLWDFSEGALTDSFVRNLLIILSWLLMQPLSSSRVCLFKAPLPTGPLSSDWSAPGSLIGQHLRRAVLPLH